MGTISSARAYYGLIASGAYTGTNVSGSGSVGVNQTTDSFATADICYSAKITSTTAGDVATLTLATGAIVKTTGTPNVARLTGGTSDLAALDFEGAAIPSMVRLYAVLVTTPVVGSDITISIFSGGTVIGSILCGYAHGGTNTGQFVFSGGQSITSLDLSATFADAADEVTITILGKSS